MRRDDHNIKCWWDAELGGWVSIGDEATVSDRMRKIIEAHEEFDGWRTVCADCGNYETDCECEVCRFSFYFDMHCWFLPICLFFFFFFATGGTSC